MTELLAGTLTMDESLLPHLQPMEVASYVDGVASADSRARIEQHLVECAACRDEVLDASRVSASLARAKFGYPRLWIPAVVVAAALVLMVRSDAPPIRDRAGEHREAPVTSTIAPRAIAPIGLADSVAVLLWSSVPHASRYQVRLFDGDGSVLWKRETTDTAADLPATIALRSGRTYFWKVEAHTGFGRTAATELIEFTIRESRPR